MSLKPTSIIFILLPALTSLLSQAALFDNNKISENENRYIETLGACATREFAKKAGWTFFLGGDSTIIEYSRAGPKLIIIAVSW